MHESMMLYNLCLGFRVYNVGFGFSLKFVPVQDKKAKRGRKLGQRVTTKKEDAKILTTFKKLRPPGHYVDSRLVLGALPNKVKTKFGRRTVIRRLAEKGYTPSRKLCKTDPTEKTKTKRASFGRKHQNKNFQQWQAQLQGVGDLKDLTTYLPTFCCLYFHFLFSVGCTYCEFGSNFV